MFDGIKRFFGNIFGGDDDEEERRRQNSFRPQPSQQFPRIGAPRQQSQQQWDQPAQLPQQQQQQVFDAPDNSLSFAPLQKVQPKQNEQQELARLAQEKADEARQEAEQGQNWLERNLLNRESNARNAEVLARTKAASEYQERSGWDNKPEVISFGNQTLQKANKNAEAIRPNIAMDFIESLPKAAVKFEQGVGDTVDAIQQAPPRAIKSLGLDARGEETYLPQGAVEEFIYGKDPITNSRGVGEGTMNAAGGIFGDDQFGSNQNGFIQSAAGLLINAADALPVGVAAKQGVTKLGAGINSVSPNVATDVQKFALQKQIELKQRQQAQAELQAAQAAEQQAALAKAEAEVKPPAPAPVEPPAPVIPEQALYSPRELNSQLGRVDEMNTMAVDPTPAVMRREAPVVTAAPNEVPAIQQRREIQSIIQQGENELNEYLEFNPTATPQQLETAREVIQAQVSSKIEQLQVARQASLDEFSQPTVQPPATIPDAPVAPMVVADEPLPPAVSNLPAPVAPPVAAQSVTGTPNPLPTGAKLESKSGSKLAPEIPRFEPATAETVAPVARPEKLVKAATKAPEKTPQRDLPKANISAMPKSGEVGKSKGKYSKGQEYDKTNMETVRSQGANDAANTSYESFTKKIEEADGMTANDRNTAVNLQSRQKIGSAEHRRLGDLINKYNTEAAQGLGTIEKTIRKTADADQLTSRFANKLYATTDDALTIDEKSFKSVIAKNDEFVAARNARDEAVETFNTNPSKANADKVVKAFDEAEQADIAARFEEYQVASKIGSKSSNPKTKEFIKKLEQDAGVYTMDWVDSSMLSSTRVMINNFINTFGGRAEEALFGKAGAALARKFSKGGHIGGGSHSGAKLGAKLGTAKWKASMKLRQNSNENVLTKTIKNFTTTGNTIGDRNTYAGAYAGVFDHYQSKLKQQGYKGDELKQRALVNSMTDPDDVAFAYMNQALANNAMASITGGVTGGKIETMMTNGLSKMLGDKALSRVAAKAFTRLTVGFPTVIARSAKQGIKRSAGGSISAGKGIANMMSGGPADETARHFKNAVKELGSGATMVTVGAGLGASGVITGGYPPSSDKAERERWQREGITENSIKIGKDYYSLPAAMGIFALPLMLGANAGANARQGKPLEEDFASTTIQTLIETMPIDTLADSIRIIQEMGDGKDVSEQLARLGASATRAISPLGSLTNQVAKMFDPTKNDLEQGDAMAQFVARIQDGIPGLANDLPSKKVEGREIRNPGPIAKFFGASSTEQTDGVEATAANREVVNAATKDLSDKGVFNDNIRNILDDETQELFDRAKGGETLEEDDLKKVINGVTKGVTQESDTRFLEDGDYDGNLTVLKVKRDMLAADPTTRNSVLEEYDTQIKRGEIYKDKKVPYNYIKDYKDINLTEWRNMGDPDSEDYDQKRYETLWALDEAMAEAKVARGKDGNKEKQKYYAKAASKGRSGGRSGRTDAQRAADKAASDALRKIQSNTLSSPVALKKIDFGNLRPEKVNSGKIPTIQQVKAGDLIKKRKISVGKA